MNDIASAPAQAQPVVAGEPGQAWWAALPPAIISALFLLLAATEPAAPFAGLVVAVPSLALGAARAVAWRTGVGRRRLVATNEHLYVLQGTRVLHQMRWSDIQRVELGGGRRYPEWTAWATFPRVLVVDASRSNRYPNDVFVSLLLRGNATMTDAERALSAACGTHQIPFTRA